MTTNVIQIDFTKPAALKLDDQIVLRDMWKALGEPYGDYSRWAEEKLHFYRIHNDIEVQHKKIPHPNGGRPAMEIVVSIQVALEIAANGHGDIGHKVRRFFGQCLRIVSEERQAKQGSSLSVLRAMLDHIEQQDLRLEKIETTQSDNTLTTAQQNTILDLCKRKARQLGNLIVNGLVKRDLKAKFGLDKSNQTFKDIPQSEFDTAVAFIESWTPTCADMKKYNLTA